MNPSRLFIVRPVATLVVHCEMPSLPLTASSSRFLISSQFSRFSPRRFCILTSTKFPLRRSPASENLRSPRTSPSVSAAMAAG